MLSCYLFFTINVQDIIHIAKYNKASIRLPIKAFYFVKERLIIKILTVKNRKEMKVSMRYIYNGFCL